MNKRNAKEALRRLDRAIFEFCHAMEDACSQSSYDLLTCYKDCPLNRKTLGGINAHSSVRTI